MYLAVEVGKFVKQVVTEWCPSTTGPLLPTMTEWAGYLVPTGVLPPFDNCGAHRTACPTNTPVWTALIWDQIVRWTGGGGALRRRIIAWRRHGRQGVQSLRALRPWVGEKKAPPPPFVLHPLVDCCQVTVPHPHVGEPHYHRTHTFSGTEIALQNEGIQRQDSLAFMLIRDAVICIIMLRPTPKQVPLWSG